MKKIVVVFVIGLLNNPTIQAQGTIYLSNTAQTSVGSEAVANDSWLAADFRTGSNVGGYLLDSVQLKTVAASGNPNGITVMLYSSVSGGAVLPDGSLGTLSGSTDPLTAGVYAYTSATDLLLSPNTHYFIVLNAATPTANGSYEWSVTDTPTVSLNGWSGNMSLCYSSDGSSWSFFSGLLAQYAISATAIPEPSMSWLLLFGSGVLFYARKRR